jgi:hypothetical protein
VYDPPVSSDTDLLSAHTHTTDTVVTNGGTLLNDAVAAFKGASRSRSRSKSGTLSMGTTTGTGTRSAPPLRIRLRRRLRSRHKTPSIPRLMQNSAWQPGTILLPASTAHGLTRPTERLTAMTPMMRSSSSRTLVTTRLGYSIRRAIASRMITLFRMTCSTCWITGTTT